MGGRGGAACRQLCSAGQSGREEGRPRGLKEESQVSTWVQARCPHAGARPPRKMTQRLPPPTRAQGSKRSPEVGPPDTFKAASESLKRAQQDAQTHLQDTRAPALGSSPQGPRCTGLEAGPREHVAPGGGRLRGPGPQGSRTDEDADWLQAAPVLRLVPRRPPYSVPAQVLQLGPRVLLPHKHQTPSVRQPRACDPPLAQSTAQAQPHVGCG